jgi:Fe-S cluster biosynthesis and repair protein YggX
MTRTVKCQLLGEELPGLEFQTYPGELGKRIFENISAQAWESWISHQTILINEHRLSPINPEHRKFLEEEMEKFFFGEGSEVPDAFVPE